MTALARIARDASALPEAAGCCAVCWETSDGKWHTAYTDDADSIPAATMATVAVARDGTLIETETQEAA